MTNTDHDQPEVADMFERTLLDSARGDSVSAEATEQAWLRFSGLLAGAAVSVGGAHAATQSAASAGLLSRLGAGKYLLLGALGGSALTFAWLGSHRVSRQLSPMRVVAAPLTTPPSAVVPSQSSNGSVLAPSLETAPAHTAAARARLARSSANARLREPPLAKADQPSSTQSPSGSALASSTLSAEVAALDAARAASRAGAYNRALDLLGQYQANFPTGVLRGDAEVASIEALYENGDRREAARRAAEFLVQFPNDPHSTAVRRLLGP
jgi:TolA-binding protein